MKIGYCDCFSGISGDMFLGALIDVGASPEEIFGTVRNVLGEGGFDVTVVKEHRGGIWGTRVVVKSGENRSFGAYKAIRKKLEDATIPEDVKKKSLGVFDRLAEAEARIHNISIDDVRFHELGCVDTIVDVVGVVAGLKFLRIEELFCSPLPMGKGTVVCHHGELPNPPPAVLEVLRGVPVYGVDKARELVTPTGAALVAELSGNFQGFPAMYIDKTGYGVGKAHDKNPPNLLRFIIGDKRTNYDDEMVVLETNIDDMNPQVFSHLFDMLLSLGAMDVWVTPCFMKKNRPGWVVSVLCNKSLKNQIEEMIFEETSTAGIRSYSVSRRILKRIFIAVETSWGQVKVKFFLLPDGKVKASPEYDDCVKISSEKGVSFRDVYNMAYEGALRLIRDGNVKFA